MSRFGTGVRAVQIAFAAFWTAGVVHLVFMPSGASAPRADAPRATAACYSADRLEIAVRAAANLNPAAPITVELVGPRADVFQTARQASPAGGDAVSLRFSFPRPPLKAAQVVVRCSDGKAWTDVSLSKILLAKAHETTLFASPNLIAGSPGVLRCAVHGVRSLSETIPLSASITVSLTGADKKVHTLYSGRTNAKGVGDVRFQVPQTPAGLFILEVVTKSMLSEETLRHGVKVLSSAKVLLTTDKPLYQPGQTIHLRALALRSFDLIPVGKAAITLEVEDGKGNKVFKKALQTSPHGIAHADFTLADEVNMGEYRIRAVLGEHTAEKTVAVKRYVLPKFKVELKTDRSYYLPHELIKGTLQADYFFGKPVSGATVEVKASTFAAAARQFQVWKGKTGAAGDAQFEIRLPAYFAGAPLQKGNAGVRLEAVVTDPADHAETTSHTSPVSDQPIQVSFIPESGRVVPDLENRIFVAALYPDGTPAKCSLDVWMGRTRKGKPAVSVRTNDSGLAELKLTPAAKQFRAGEWNNSSIEFIDNIRNRQTRTDLLDLVVQARDARGARATATAALGADPLGENVLLHLDRAIYRAGDRVGFDVRSSAGLPTVYLEVVKAGQTMLTKWFDIGKGQASGKLDLPPNVFGTLEVHAYQILLSGEIIRDTRVVYVHPAGGLKVKVSADRQVYKPGGEGLIRFEVTDSAGNPSAAALGVLVVDEAVYALQEMQPGLEKVYFTLQQELFAPKDRAAYRPAESMDALIREPDLADDRQQLARALFASVRTGPRLLWSVAPDLDRKENLLRRMTQLGTALFDYGLNQSTVLTADPRTGRPRFPSDVLDRVVRERAWMFADEVDAMGRPVRKQDAVLKDPLGGKLTLQRLAELEPGFSPEAFAWMVTRYRMEGLVAPLLDRDVYRRKWFAQGSAVLLERMMIEASLLSAHGAVARKDGWGRDIKLVKRSVKSKKASALPGLPGFTLVSAGPDGKFGTDDDVVYEPIDYVQANILWWKQKGARTLGAIPPRIPFDRGRFNFGFQRGVHFNMGAGGFQQGGFGVLGGALGALGGALGGGFPIAGGPGGMANLGGAGGLQVGRAAPIRPALRRPADVAPGGDKNAPPGAPIQAAPARLREYFPETLLWQPSLITDDRGRATLKVPFADSITTWRLSASASSLAGGLGGASAPLRVFQDFFVDLDLPVALTQNDEVAFPVAVYSYLKSAQSVNLELKPEPWFDLIDGQGLKRTLKIEANQVTSVKFRIRAKKVGRFSLTIDARGDRTSDAVKRSIEVLPDGAPVEQVHSGQLAGAVKHTITIPPSAIDGASRLLVKVYPGVHSQLLEGVEGMLRMPHGCFEQSSSSIYPSNLAMDYLKKNRIASPATLTRAEQVVAAGCQRLLTFERPGGGFDLWGTGPPDVWLSAYGLQEFNDMAKVYPIDTRVIDRTRAWLVKQQADDGTWSRTGDAVHRVSNSKLLLTSYVAWALLDGVPRPAGLVGMAEAARFSKAIDYIQDGAARSESAYVLALAANALAARDAGENARKAVKALLAKLDAKKMRKPEWNAVCYPSTGMSLCCAQGESLTVETTALAVLAMVRVGQQAAAVNPALAYLVKSRGADGTWGTTQATILAMKALLAGMGGAEPKGVARFVVKVAGKRVADGAVSKANSDVMQQFDLREHLRTGANEVAIEVKGETSLLYQIAGRHFEPHRKRVDAVKPLLDLSLGYDRTRLTTADRLKANAVLRWQSKTSAYQVIVELPIPPGFTVDAGDFADLAAARKVQRFSVSARQVTLYLGDVKPESVHAFTYSLKPRYPLKAQAPAAVAYEYYTPTNRAATRSVPLVVEE